MFQKNKAHFLFIFILVIFCCAQISFAFSITTYPESDFDADQSVMNTKFGITNYIVEDFEDSHLVDGLSIKNGEGSIIKTILNVYDPKNWGVQSLWDGNYVLLNSTDNTWTLNNFRSRITFYIKEGTTSFAIGLANYQRGGTQDYPILINGKQFIKDIGSLPNYTNYPDTERNIYLKIDANFGERIESVTFGYDGSDVDGLIFDHLAFKQTNNFEIYKELVSYYPFENDVSDASGNGYHGDEQGGNDYESGIKNNAKKFDGIDNWINLKNHPFFDYKNNNFCISYWVKPFSQPDYFYRFITRRSANNAYSATLIHGITKNNFEFNFYYPTNSNNTSQSFGNDFFSYPLTLNIWHHFLFTRNDDQLFFYVNGNLVDIKNVEGHTYYYDKGNAYIGRDVFQGGNTYGYFDGLIDEIKFFNRFLSESEIKILYDYEASYDSTQLDLNNGLVAHYEFENNTNDSSGNQNHGTENGGLNYSAGIIGNCAKFDGINDYVQAQNSVSGSIYSIAVWIKTSSSSGRIEIVSGGTHSTDGNKKDIGFYLYEYNKNIKFDITNHHVCVGNTSVVDSRWHFIAGISTGKKLKLYVDGIIESEGYATPDIKGSILRIGRFTEGDDNILNYWNGNIDDVRIYNRALTPEEINALYLMGANTITTEIKDQNTQQSENISLKDIDELDGQYYAISNNTLYVSIDAETFIKLHETESPLNAIASAWHYVLAVGETGSIVMYNATTEEIETITDKPDITENFLDVAVADDQYVKAVIVGTNGTIIKGISAHFSKIDSPTTADITSVSYDQSSKTFYATTSNGELLTSQDINNWTIQTTIPNTRLTSFEKHDNLIVLTGENGKIFYATNNYEFTEATADTSDHFVDVWFVKNKFIAATNQQLFVSLNAQNWGTDATNFTDSPIQNLFLNEKDNALFVLTEKGIRKIYHFNQIESGSINEAIIGGVSVRFNQSSVVYENNQIKSIELQPDDTLFILNSTGKTIAKIHLSDASIQDSSQNGIPFSRADINGDNLLSYCVSDNQFVNVSQGEFLLENKTIMEMPLLNPGTTLQEKIRIFIADYYKSLFDSVAPDLQQTMVDDIILETILNKSKLLAKIKNYQMPITANYLLLGSPEKMFSPIVLSSPFFRKLWLDTTTGKIKQTDTFFLGPRFIAQELLTLFNLKNAVKIPKLSYELDGHKLTGTITTFQMTFGPFQAVSKKAQVISDLSNDQADDYILLDNATFQLKTKNKGTQKSPSTGSIGLNACKIMLAHNKKDGFRLKSGEAGGELKLSNIQLTKQWTLQKLHTTLKMLARKKDPSDTSHYLDKYPDELNDVIVTIGGEGTLVKKSLLKKNTLSISAKVEVALDEDSLDFYGNDQQNLIEASMGVKSKINYPPKGPLTLEGAGLNYKYVKDKKSQSFWTLEANFNMFRLAPSVELFKGKAKLMADTDFESIALEISSLRTYFPFTDYNLNWMGHNSTGACAFYGKIYPNHPLQCPGIKDCNGETFYLKPLEGYFEGVAIGIAASANLMHKNKILTIGSTSTAQISFEEIIRRGIAEKSLGVSDDDTYNYDVNVGLVGNIDFKLPKIKSKYFPSDWIDKGSFQSCISLTHIKINEKIKHWFADDENIYLGKIFGLLVSFNKNKLFIPFSRLVDNEGEQIYFVAPMFHTQFTLSKRKRATIKQGDLLTDQFALNQSSRVIIDLNSDNNDISVIMPDNSVITQETENSGNIDIKVKDNEYTVLYIDQPLPGTYTVTYQHTGNERLTIYKTNDPPSGYLSLSGNSVSFSISDTENDIIDYRLAVMDDNSQPIHYILQNQGTEISIQNYEIPDISHLQTGNYKLGLFFKDELNAMQQIISENTIYCQKTIPQPENLKTIVISDYVTLSWDTAKGVTGYTVNIMSNDELIYQFDIAASTLTIQDLMDGNYKAVITGYDDNGMSGLESQIDFTVTQTTSSIIPEPVSNIRVDFGDPLKILWDPSENAAFYAVSLKKGNKEIFSETDISQPYIEPGQDERGSVLTISITAKSETNNRSEPVIQTLNMFDMTDEDNDMLPDMWETYYFKSIEEYSGNDDPDLDGLSNALEFSMTTNPMIVDTDNDHIEDHEDPNPLNDDDLNANIIPDDWEHFYAITDILADTDNDGYSNYIEYLAGFDPTTKDDPDIDMSGFLDMEFSPVLISNIDHLSMIRQFESFVIDLSQSFDINGDNLTFKWIINGDTIDSNSNSNRLTLDTSKPGMYRVEVNVRDSKSVAYQKYSIFVTDGQYHRIDGGKTQTVALNKYTFNFPAAAMKSNAYGVIGEISRRQMPVRIMGREIVTDGAVFLYSDNYCLNSPVTIIPDIKADNEVEPYIFNYSTSVWTNLNTGETFTPIYAKKYSDNTDQSYKITTRETGILVFARIPKQITLSPVTSIDTHYYSYFVDLDVFKQEKQLSEIDDIMLSDNQLVDYQKGFVSGSDQLMINILKTGMTELSIVGTNMDGSKVRYTYILKIVRAKLDDDLLNAMTILKICSGIDPLIDTTDLDFNQNQQMDLSDAIYLLQRLAEMKSDKQ